jgi:hypothetical protein
MKTRTGLKITNIDFSDEILEQRFEIEHDNNSPDCLELRIVDKNLPPLGEQIDHIITLRASEMKALGKALVFAAEYVEGLYSEDGHNF